jgi:hypothetical protein
MRSIGRFLAFALLAPAALFAQHLSHPVGVSRDDAFSPARAGGAAQDTLRILAVMVQFAADTDPYTSGTGWFDLSAPTDSLLDAPPRNAAYFRDHLVFVKNYFARVSRGKQPVTSRLLDSVITLASPMSAYSPGGSDQSAPVARLARDSWRRVDSLGLVPDFSRYNCFIVFHAGIGRDVNLVSLLGYDPTPNDIPSLYIGPSAFQSLIGGGIPVNNGSFTITHSLVIPESENRLVPGIGGDYQLELGINGMLCAAIGNRLGLPDLYDTKTGNSGIGRFGLMDGQAIFSFNGAFPPAPSAWEKAWLGWITPITLPAGTSTVTLPAVEISDTVYRIPVSATEYFLVENRNRQPAGSGVTVTSTYNGVQQTQHFAADLDRFYAYDVSGLSGTVTDVDDPDWSLPGGTSDKGELFDGGVLIWHIDESVIRAHASDNAVNADPARRGVNLMEADGSQDIGQTYDQFSAASGSESGTAIDFWFKGNSSPVNTNEFSGDTRPNSNSSLGAPTHIAISGFSARGIRMSATVQNGDATASPVKGYPRTLYAAAGPGGLTVVASGTKQLLAASTGPVLSLLPPDSTGRVPPFTSNGGFAAAGSGSFSGAIAFDIDGDGATELLSASSGAGISSVLHAYSLTTAGPDSLASEKLSRAIGSGTATQLVSGDSLVVMATSAGRVYLTGRGGSTLDSLSLSSPVCGISAGIPANTFVVVNGDSLNRLTFDARGTWLGAATFRSIGHRISGAAANGLFGRSASDSRFMISFSTADGWLYLVDSSLSIAPGFPLHLADAPLTPPILADVDGDGIRDVIVAGGRTIYAVNRSGAILDNFPVDVTRADTLMAPVAGDLNGDGVVDIAAVSANGLLAATDRRGKLLAGFPIPVTPGSGQSLAIIRNPAGVFAALLSPTGVLSLWRTGSPPANDALLYPWPQAGADAGRTGRAMSLAGTAVAASEFLPRDRAYNWPNPVTDGTTHIRYFVRDDAAVRITILDLAGDKVDEFRVQAKGGLDNEVLWNAAGVQSGVYLARIEAEGAGTSGVAIIKVAVVK